MVHLGEQVARDFEFSTDKIYVSVAVSCVTATVLTAAECVDIGRRSCRVRRAVFVRLGRSGVDLLEAMGPSHDRSRVLSVVPVVDAV